MTVVDCPVQHCAHSWLQTSVEFNIDSNKFGKTGHRLATRPARVAPSLVEFYRLVETSLATLTCVRSVAWCQTEGRFQRLGKYSEDTARKPHFYSWEIADPQRAYTVSSWSSPALRVRRRSRLGVLTAIIEAAHNCRPSVQ